MSVMSVAGAARRFLEAIFDLYREMGMEEVSRVVYTGDQHGVTTPGGHHCRMYRWEDLKVLLERHPCEVVAASDANFLSVRTRRCSKRANETLYSGRPCWSGRRGSANRAACSTLASTS